MAKETRFYLIDLRLEPYHGMDIGYKSLTDEDFIKISEEQELVYTKGTFVDGFNEEYFDSYNFALKILDVEV